MKKNDLLHRKHLIIKKHLFLTDPHRCHAELQQWFRKQCENPWDRFYLYYLESYPGHDGGLLICKVPPENLEYKLATPEAILRNLSIGQNMVHFHSVLMRLPVLNVE